jgi:hypothetical protein
MLGSPSHLVTIMDSGDNLPKEYLANHFPFIILFMLDMTHVLLHQIRLLCKHHFVLGKLGYVTWQIYFSPQGIVCYLGGGKLITSLALIFCL